MDKILFKRTKVAGRVPSASAISEGELQLNLADGKLFTKNGSTVISIGGGGGSLDVLIGSEQSFPVFPSNTTPGAEWVKKDGALLSRTAYPALYKWAVDKGLVVPEFEWQSHVMLEGAVSYYSSGTNDTNFRVPAVGTNGVFQRPRGTDHIQDDIDVIHSHKNTVQPLTFAGEALPTHKHLDGTRAYSAYNNRAYPYGSQASTGDGFTYGGWTASTSQPFGQSISAGTPAGTIKGTGAETAPDFQWVSVWIYSGNSTTSLPAPTADWLNQQQVNTNAIAAYDANLANSIDEIKADQKVFEEKSGRFGLVKLNDYTNYLSSLGEGIDGKLYCWGEYSQSNIPSGGAAGKHHGFYQVAIDYRGRKIKKWGQSGHEGFCLFEDGDLWGWGFNQHGRLGQGNTTQIYIPKIIKENVDDFAIPITMGSDHNQASTYIKIKGSGNWYYAGYNPHDAMCGGSAGRKYGWTLVANLPTNEDIVKLWPFGGAFSVTFAQTRDGDLYAVGYNGYGNLGTGNKTNATKWTKVVFPISTTEIFTVLDIKAACGYSTTANPQSSTMFLMGDPVVGYGRVYTCGDNTWGQLGNGSALGVDAVTPTWILRSYSIRAIYQNGDGPASRFAIENKLHERTWAWGYNVHGQLGVGSTDVVATPVETGGQKIREIYANNGSTNAAYKSCILAAFDDGAGGHTLKGTGFNAHGQIGDGTLVSKSSWTQSLAYSIDLLNDKVYNVHLGASDESCVFILRSDNTLYGFGLGTRATITGPLCAVAKSTNSVPVRLC